MTREEKSTSGPKVVNDLYALVLWYLQATPKFPRSHRFTLGERIERTCLDAMEVALSMTYSRTKVAALHELNGLLDRLRLLTRLATDLRLFSPAQQEFCAKALMDVGRQVGGWRRSLEKPGNRKTDDIPSSS